MKKVTFLSLLVAIAVMTSCTGSREIGRLNMVSVRNIDTQTKYQLIQKNLELFQIRNMYNHHQNIFDNSS